LSASVTRRSARAFVTYVSVRTDFSGRVAICFFASSMARRISSEVAFDQSMNRISTVLWRMKLTRSGICAF
jgi:hypothetical protein